MRKHIWNRIQRNGKTPAVIYYLKLNSAHGKSSCVWLFMASQHDDESYENDLQSE